MNAEIEDENDQAIYGHWTRVLGPVLGDPMFVHYDLYELTHKHRVEHNRQSGEGVCTAWPSPPYRAPLWPLGVATLRPTRFLELGCALGYTAALMAEAGGPEARVDTIENDRLHAEMAQRQLSRKGLADRVRILRGDENDIIPTLMQAYDVVFADGGGRETEVWPELKRLTRHGGVRIAKEVLRDEVGRIVAQLEESAGKGGQRVRLARAKAEEAYREAVVKCMVVT